MTTRLFSDEDDSSSHDRRRTRRRTDDNRTTSFAIELMKLIFPVLLAWGVSYMTSRSEAVEAAQREIAVVKNTEQLHFEEIQRTLSRLDAWITEQERAQRRNKQ